MPKSRSKHHPLLKVAGFTPVKTPSGVAYEREIQLVNGKLRMIISSETAKEIKDNKTLAIAIAQLAFNGGQHSKTDEIRTAQYQLENVRKTKAEPEGQLTGVRRLLGSYGYE